MRGWILVFENKFKGYETNNVSTDIAHLTWRQRHHSTIRAVRLYARTFARNGSAMFGLFLVMLIVITAIIAPWIVPYPEDAIGAVHRPKAHATELGSLVRY